MIKKSIKKLSLIFTLAILIVTFSYLTVNAEENVVETIELEAPEEVYAYVEKGKAYLSWEGVDYAEGYEIYNEDKLVGSTTNLSYTVSNLPSSKISILKVRAYAIIDEETQEKNYSKFKGKNVFPSTVSGVKTTLISKDAIKITWSKNENASGYKVYRSTSQYTGYKQIKDITSKNTVSYTDKKLSKAKTYYYKVVPYKKYNEKIYHGGESKASSKTTFNDAKIGNSILMTEAGNPSIRVSWMGAEENVNGYEVFRATSKNGKYKKIATVSKNKICEYTDKNLARRKKYYYKVRGYKKINGKKYYTKFSSVKGLKTCNILNYTLIPHHASTYYGDKATVKSISTKYRKVSGSKAVYQVKMKVKIEAYYASPTYFTLEYYDKYNRYVGSSRLDFNKKAKTYTTTLTWNNVKIPKKAVSFTIK